MVQCQVICPEADFCEVYLDKHVIDGCIEIAPISEERGSDENPGNELTTYVADPQS